MTDEIKARQDNCCATHDELVAGIMVAYLTNNTVNKDDLPGIFTSLRSAMAGTVANAQSKADSGAVTKATKAQIERSITADYLVSFIDGKQYKTLRRHLNTHGMTVEQYRLRYGLPVDYPLVAPEYSQRRSELAKSLGLGHVGRKEAA